jgi:hypothetical protein
MPWVMSLPTFPTMTSRPLLLYAAAVHAAQAFGNRVELRGLEPLTFWLQTIFFAYLCTAQRRSTSYLPAATVADRRQTSREV